MRASIPLLPIAFLLASAAFPAVSLAGDKPVPPSPSASSSSSAAASSSSAPSQPRVPETADSLYNQGNDAYDRGDFALAAELYTGAFKLRTSYDIARNLGLSQLKLGKVRAAIGNFTYSLSHYPSNRADTKKQVVEWLAQAKTQAGVLRLTVEPEGAPCTVNGSAVSQEEREGDVFVDPGQNKIECGGSDGYSKDKQTVSVDKGATVKVKIKVVRTGKGPDPVPTAGYYSLPPATQWKITLTGLGLATVAGIGGIVSAILSGVKSGEAESSLASLRTSTGRAFPCAPPAVSGCADVADARNVQDVTGNVAFYALLGGATVGAFTASYLWPRSTAKPKVGVVVAPSTSGMVLTGSW